MLNDKHAIEQAIHEQLDARDEVTCTQYAEHCATWVEPELVLKLCLALIRETRPTRLIFNITELSPELGNALDNLYTHIDKHRAEFLEEEAQNRLRAAEAEAIARADFQAETDAESRRLLR